MSSDEQPVGADDDVDLARRGCPSTTLLGLAGREEAAQHLDADRDSRRSAR